MTIAGFAMQLQRSAKLHQKYQTLWRRELR